MENTVDLNASHWSALYTRPRFEKKVDSLLQEKGFKRYLPLHIVVKQWSDRIKKVREPLFRLLCLSPNGFVREDPGDSNTRCCAWIEQIQQAITVEIGGCQVAPVSIHDEAVSLRGEDCYLELLGL